MKKVLFISSTGGHLNELMQLSPLFDKYNYHIITEKDKSTQNLKEKYNKKISYLKYGSRKKIITYPFRIFYMIQNPQPDNIKRMPERVRSSGHSCLCY